MRIGLTGSTGCGKSTVSQYLRELQYFVSDADAVSRMLTAPGGAALPLIRKAFGDSVFSGNDLNRRALSRIVFGSEEERQRLNGILHPMIFKSLDAELRQHENGDKPVFADLPLLFECHREKMFDRVWVVTVNEEIQIQRLMERDGLSRSEILNRIHSQMPSAEKEKLADLVIHTDGTIEETKAQILAALSGLPCKGGL